MTSSSSTTLPGRQSGQQRQRRLRELRGARLRRAPVLQQPRRQRRQPPPDRAAAAGRSATPRAGGTDRRETDPRGRRPSMPGAALAIQRTLVAVGSPSIAPCPAPTRTTIRACTDAACPSRLSEQRPAAGGGNSLSADTHSRSEGTTAGGSPNSSRSSRTGSAAAQSTQARRAGRPLRSLVQFVRHRLHIGAWIRHQQHATAHERRAADELLHARHCHRTADQLARERRCLDEARGTRVRKSHGVTHGDSTWSAGRIGTASPRHLQPVTKRDAIAGRCLNMS